MADILSVNLQGRNYNLYELEAQPGITLTQSEIKEYQETGRLPQSTIDAFNRSRSLDSDTINISAAASSAASEKVSEVSGSNRAKSAEELQIEAEIEALEAQKTEKLDKIEKIEAKIETLIEKAEEKVSKAAEEQEKAAEDYEEETKKAVRDELQKYVQANKNGEGMTKDELSENIKKAAPDSPSLAAVTSAITEAGGIADEIDFCVSGLKSLINEVQSIENEIAFQEQALEAAKEAAKEAQKPEISENAKCCDPIGFEYEGETYDFIVDDGAFDSADDFLGASDNWAAMQKLDTNGDNTVDIDELSAGNIKAVKSNGTTVDLEKTFGKDFSINLASYNKNGSYAGIDTGDDDGDGAANQQLLGTFGLSIAGKSITGYNTLDDTDWLNSKFGIGKGEAKASAAGLTLSSGLQAHMDKAEYYSKKAEEIREKAHYEYEHLGMTREEISELEDVLADEAVSNAENFFTSLYQNNLEDNLQEEKKEKEKKV